MLYHVNIDFSLTANRNKNLETLFTVSCSMDYVSWPNTETSSLHLPALLQNYTHSSGTQRDVCLSSCCNLTIQHFIKFCLFLFRILVQICKTQAFQKLNPAQFDLHDEVCDAIQVRGHTQYYHQCFHHEEYLILCTVTIVTDRNSRVVHHQERFTSADD